MSLDQANITEQQKNLLSDVYYLRFNQLLLEKVGLQFNEIRRGELESAVMQSFASSTFSRLDDYYAFLNDETDGGVELERLINTATVNETHFFRDSAQFDALTSHVLPELIKRRQSIRTLRLWSAGCSSGEEAYSLAILLHELLPDLNDWSITILATDVNTNALDRARKAVYSSWSFREDKSRQYRDKYFTPLGSQWELIPEVRRMVTFNRMNLNTSNYPAYETNTTYMDLILCRNVLIYLGEVVTQAMIGRFFECLQPGGWLVVAPAEGSPTLFKRFKAYTFPSAILYQRLTQTAVLRQKNMRHHGSDRSLPAHGSAASNVPTTPVQPPRPSPVKADPALPSFSPEEEQALFEQAQELITYGLTAKALEILQKLVNARQIKDKVCALLGQLYANRGDWHQAENWCVQSIYHNRLSLDAYYTLSLVYQHKEKWEHAIEAMRKVVYIDHTDILGHFGLANLYFEHGQMPKAIKSLDNAFHLLDNRSPDELVKRSGGITVGRLRDAIIRQQQQWNGMIPDPSEFS